MQAVWSVYDNAILVLVGVPTVHVWWSDYWLKLTADLIKLDSSGTGNDLPSGTPHTRIRAAKLFRMFVSRNVNRDGSRQYVDPMHRACRGGYRRSNYITVISRSSCSTNTNIQGPSLFSRRPRRLCGKDSPNARAHLQTAAVRLAANKQRHQIWNKKTPASRKSLVSALTRPCPPPEVKLSRPDKRWSLIALVPYQVTWYDRTALKI